MEEDILNYSPTVIFKGPGHPVSARIYVRFFSSFMFCFLYNHRPTYQYYKDVTDSRGESDVIFFIYLSKETTFSVHLSASRVTRLIYYTTLVHINMKTKRRFQQLLFVYV